jgi:hypothetical protein
MENLANLANPLLLSKISKVKSNLYYWSNGINNLDVILEIQIQELFKLNSKSIERETLTFKKVIIYKNNKNNNKYNSTTLADIKTSWQNK